MESQNSHQCSDWL